MTIWGSSIERDGTRHIRSAATTVNAVARLVYATIMSLDGYTTDVKGNIDWGAPEPDVLEFINDLERGIGTYLYGRKMYETMVYWETFDGSEGQQSLERDFADLWRDAVKVVYSKTLAAATSAKTRIEPVFDPEVVLRMKESAGSDISVGGPNLAGQAILAGLVDEMHLFLTPVALGGGTAALPDHFDSKPALVGVDHFPSGVAHLHYRIGA
jgi:dihydrofolate reductase